MIFDILTYLLEDTGQLLSFIVLTILMIVSICCIAGGVNVSCYYFTIMSKNNVTLTVGLALKYLLSMTILMFGMSLMLAIGAFLHK